MKGLRTTCLLFSDPKAAQVIAAAGSEDLQHLVEPANVAWVDPMIGSRVFWTTSCFWHLATP